MKKLLALLIAVMMVVAMVPATMLSVLAAELDAGAGNGGGETDTPITPAPDTSVGDGYEFIAEETDLPDERLEEEAASAFDKEFTEGVDNFELVNKDGTLVGYFADLAAADAWVRNGDTLRFLADVTLTSRYDFGNGRTQLAGQITAYTIDGNGHTVTYTGTNNYAIGLYGDLNRHTVTFTDLKLISARGGIESSAGSGKGMRVVLDNVQVYANDSYYAVDPTAYGAGKLTYNGTTTLNAVCAWTVNTYIVIKGENTKIHGGNGPAIWAHANVALYDGEIYSAGNDVTIAVRGDKRYSNRTEHTFVAYGGTVINEKGAAVRILGGASGYFFGGSFVQTAEKSTTGWATAVRAGGTEISDATGQDGQTTVGQIYIMGGNFYVDNGGAAGVIPAEGAAVSTNAGGPVYIAGGSFYYTGAKAYGGNDSSVLLSASVKAETVEVTEENTLTVPSGTVTFAKMTTVSFDLAQYAGIISADGTLADADALSALGFEAAILDADGKVMDLLHLDKGDAETSIHFTTDGAAMTSIAALLERSSLMTPDGGTYFLLADLIGDESTESADIFTRLPYGEYTLDGNGHTIEINNKALYICYTAGGATVNLRNVTMRNTVGRGLQYNSGVIADPVWNLTDTKIIAGAGSTVYMPNSATLNLLEGSELVCPESTETWAYLIQMNENATLNVDGGTLRCFTTELISRAPFVANGSAGTRYINLKSGTIVLPTDTLMSLYYAENPDRVANIVISPEMSIVDLDGNPVLMPGVANTVQLTNPGAEPAYYSDIADAIADAVEGAVIELLADVVAAKAIKIDFDLTLKGNGYTVYDMSQSAYTPFIWITGEGVDVTVDALTVVTQTTGMLVSPNAFSDLTNSSWGIDGAKYLSTDLNAKDANRINVVLNNCKILTNVYDESGYDAIDTAEGMANFRAVSGTSRGSLIMHGQNVYVKITGADGMYASAAGDFTIANIGGFLDIYDGLVYGHDAYNVLGLYGRTDISALTDNQVRSATTAIYGGRFIAGPKVDASLIRTLRGHTLVIAGGEFLQTTSGSQVVRASDSNRAGYGYILGGDFYNDNGNGIFGYGNADVGYFRIYGGNFFAKSNPGIATTKKPTYFFNYNGYETSNRLGVSTTYGMYIDAGYQIDTYGYAESPVYNANTKLEYVKKGFTHLQSVHYDEQWLAENGYLEEGIAYLVTNGEDQAPTAFYGFELERALFYLGNGGTFTLTRDITWKQPAKATQGEDDTDYGVHTRCRPAVAEMTFNSSAKDGYYTLTATASDISFLTVQGGTFYFNNIGIVNKKGGVIGVRSTYNTTLYFTDGYYEANTTATSACDGIVTNIGNTAYFIGGTFTSDRAAITVNAYAKLYFGIEGTQQGPTIIQKDNQAIWIGGGAGMEMNFYYATFRDTGTKGCNLQFANTAQNFTLNIYDGYFFVNNKGNYQVIGSDNGATGNVNIYGGTFIRGNTGPGDVGYGKLFIFQHDGEVNLYGGTFRTLVSGNTMMTIRNNVVKVNIGNPETGEGPTIQTNGGHAIQIDNNYNTNATVKIYGGTMTGSDKDHATILMGQNGDTGTVTATLDIYNVNINAAGRVLIVGDDDIAHIYDGVFTAGADSNMFYTNTNSKLHIHGGDFTKTGNNLYYPGNNSVLTVTGGNFNVKTFSWYNGSGTYTVNLGSTADVENDDIYVYATSAFFGTDGAFTGKLNLNIYSGTYETNTTGNTIYIYGSGSGSIKLYGGDFWEYGGGSRMFRIGGSFSGDMGIYGGTYKQESTSDLLCIVDNSRVDLTLGREDGTGPVMSAVGDSIVQYSYAHTSTDPVSVRVLGGSYTVTGGSSSVFGVWSLPAGSTMVFENDPVVQAIENCTGWAVDYGCAGTTLTVNGGSFSTYGNVDACFSVGGGTGIINAGYFYAQGLCVARAIGGKASTADTELDKGVIETPTDAKLIINGGLFVLAENWERNQADDGDINDAVIRVGGWTGHGTVIINDGTFISNSGVGHRVINKYNPAGIIEINGGIFMASEIQKYYFCSTGTFVDQSGNPINGSADPDRIDVDPAKDLQIAYAGKTYYTLMLNQEDYIDYHSVTGKGDIRIMKIELGNEDQYQNGIRFTTSISKAYLEQYAAILDQAIDGVTFGTIIVPADYLEKVDVLNHVTLDGAGLDYLDIAADKSLITTENNVTFTAAITDIKEENYGRRFVAIGYAMATVPVVGENVPGVDTDISAPVEPTTETVYVYAEYDAKGTSLAELGSILLEDEINATNPYSAELKALLQSFADALPEDEAPDVTPSLPGGDDVIDDPFGSDDDDNNGGEGDDTNNGGDTPEGDGGNDQNA